MISKLQEIFKEAVDLNNREDIIITTPRRASKSTFIKELVKEFLKIVDKNEIVVFAPRKRNFEDVIKEFRIIGCSTSRSARGLNPKVVLVDEATYCSNELLEEIEHFPEAKTILIGTPKKVTYTWDSNRGKWICDNYVMTLIDEGIKYYDLHLEDLCIELKEVFTEEKNFYTEEQWETEINGNWIKEIGSYVWSPRILEPLMRVEF